VAVEARAGNECRAASDLEAPLDVTVEDMPTCIEPDAVLGHPQVLELLGDPRGNLQGFAASKPNADALPRAFAVVLDDARTAELEPRVVEAIARHEAVERPLDRRAAGAMLPRHAAEPTIDAGAGRQRRYDLEPGRAGLPREHVSEGTKVVAIPLEPP